VTLLFALLLAQAHPCAADARKLCPGIKPGEGTVATCLRSHKQDLSPACRTRLFEFEQEANACRADVEKLCPGIPRGPQRMECMKSHKGDVSAACRDLANKVRDRKQARDRSQRDARAACHADVEKYCSKVGAGAGQVMACLQEHQSDLSPACAAQLKR
jgi:predicted phage gp36 major capsid-like protein